jgi:hypothetical protein
VLPNSVVDNGELHPHIAGGAFSVLWLRSFERTLEQTPPSWAMFGSAFGSTALRVGYGARKNAVDSFENVFVSLLHRGRFERWRCRRSNFLYERYSVF